MALLSLTASHHELDLDALERLSTGAHSIGGSAVAACDVITGAVVLATCNRFELYLDVDAPLDGTGVQHATEHVARLHSQFARAAFRRKRFPLNKQFRFTKGIQGAGQRGGRSRFAQPRKITDLTEVAVYRTPGFDARVLGFARPNAAGYDLYVENGSPKLPTIWTLAHELTHVWQQRTWNRAAILERYGAANELFIYEGMASWASVQYMYSTRETDFARREAALTRARDDEYGAGFRLFEKRYPLRAGGNVLRDTPFKHPFPL